MPRLNIAGILMGINTNKEIANSLRPFLSCSEKVPDIEICFATSDFITKPDGRVLMDDKIKWHCSADGFNNITVYINELCSNEIYSLMCVDQHWENAIITHRGVNSDSSMITGPIGEILFRNKLLFNQGIMMHSSVIECEGKGIMFSAPSGTGKSTQADLWERYKGAEILNGDRSVVKITDNQVYVYGSPWCGSSARFLNRRSPLNAIIILEQARENELRLLDKNEALIRLLPRCFLPYYDSGGKIMDMAFDTLDKVLSLTRIYLLRCRPDKEAVELVYQCVK